MSKHHIDSQRLRHGVQELRKAYRMDEGIEREYQLSLCLEFLDMAVTIIELRGMIKQTQ